MNLNGKLSDILDNLIFCVESSLISQGEKGEIIAKLILINAIDNCVNLSRDNKNQFSQFSKITSVGHFIQSLYGKCLENCGNDQNNWTCKSLDKTCCIKMVNKQIGKKAKFLLDGLINFNHFTKPDSYMNHVNLISALKRSAAISCKLHQKAIDFVIPVTMDRNNFDSISIVMVQVKLENKPTEPTATTALHGISPKMFKNLSANVPYLMLFMQLGGEDAYVNDIKSHKGTKRQELDKQAIIYSQGISEKIFPNLKGKIDEKLQAFSLADRKLFKADSGNEKSKIYNVLRYSLRKNK
ncbi:unnamed protein product [Brachionus calyciflorus]|uniref:Uncharacterized protein n=1 Tax=Brachionus calyciflorus TaxID=104777 RepID=A0A814GRD5_9BILA|nr:unnamed protein product [Brachionus calyciflorus]